MPQLAGNSRGIMTASESRQAAWLSAFAVIAIFLFVDHLQDLLRLSAYYRALYARFPFYVPESGKSLLQIAVCIAAVRILWVRNAIRAASELGLTSSVRQGVLFGVVAASPMYVGLALTTPLPAESNLAATAYLAGLAPLAEEALYRGFLCGLLCTRGRLPPWAALTIQAAFFGWGHIQQGASVGESAALFALITVGGFLFGWFFLRWANNVWIPFFLHAFMSLSWEVFQVSENALGGWFPFSLQAGSLLLGIVITIRWTNPIAKRKTEDTEAVARVSA